MKRYKRLMKWAMSVDALPSMEIGGISVVYVKTQLILNEFIP